MKRILLLTVSFLFLVASTGNAVMLSFNPASMAVMVGSSFSVDLMVSGLGGASVGEFDVDTHYDTSQMRFTGYTLGSLLGSNIGDIMADDSWIFDAWDLSTGDSGGTIDLAELSNLAPDVLNPLGLDTFGLATLNFECIGLGVSNISIDNNLVLGDAFGVSLSPLVGNGATVTQTPVPEPASMLLLATGLAVLTGFSSRRRKQ